MARAGTFLLIVGLLWGLPACVKRQQAASTSVTTDQGSIPLDAPPPSVIFKKKETPRASLEGGPIGRGPLGPQLEPDRIVEADRYLAATANPKPKPLKGFDHFLASLWGVAQYAVAIGGFIVFFEGPPKK